MNALTVLIEAMIDADGRESCLRHDSHGFYGILCIEVWGANCESPNLVIKAIDGIRRFHKLERSDILAISCKTEASRYRLDRHTIDELSWIPVADFTPQLDLFACA